MVASAAAYSLSVHSATPGRFSGAVSASPKVLWAISAKRGESVRPLGIPTEQRFELSLGSSIQGSSPANASSSRSGTSLATSSPISGWTKESVWKHSTANAWASVRELTPDVLRRSSGAPKVGVKTTEAPALDA